MHQLSLLFKHISQDVNVRILRSSSAKIIRNMVFSTKKSKPKARWALVYNWNQAVLETLEICSDIHLFLYKAF